MSKKPPVWWQPQTARYVVSVDNQAKSSFETIEAADAEAARISKLFPVVIVRVRDSKQDSAKVSLDEAPEIKGD